MSHIGKLCLATVSVVALAGCGSSGSSSSTSTGAAASSSSTGTAASSSSSTTSAASSSASFATEASAICSSVDRQVTALPAIKTGADLLTVGAQELAVTTAAINHLKTLTPPAGQAAAFKAYTTGLTQENVLLHGLLAAVKTKDTAKIRQIANQGKALGTADDVKARSLGLPTCAASASPKGTSSSG